MGAITRAADPTLPGRKSVAPSPLRLVKGVVGSIEKRVQFFTDALCQVSNADARGHDRRQLSNCSGSRTF